MTHGNSHTQVLRARLERAFRSVRFARLYYEIRIYSFSRHVCSNFKFEVKELTMLKSLFMTGVFTIRLCNLFSTNINLKIK